jgi:anti-sigma factor RsiW
MTTLHLNDQQISDFLDNALSPDDASVVGTHVHTCEECGRRLERMRGIVAGASALPRTMATPPDEWARIRARIDAGHRGAPRQDRWWTRRSALLAAGIALVVVSSAVTAMFINGSSNEPVVAVAPASTTGLPPRFASLETDYAAIVSELERDLASRKHTLSPETIAAVERSLRTIDVAIAEARDALAKDPGSETVARLLVASHDQKIELLRRAARLATPG